MTVRINKDAINLREKLSQLDKPSGLVGEELLRADTSADAREALNLEEHLFEDFESTGIDDNATSTVVTVSDSGVDVDGNLSFGDNDKATFGAGSDLQIYHDPTTGSYISELGAGSLFIQTNNNGVVIEKSDGTDLAYFDALNSRVALYNGGATKFLTTSTGVDVIGTVTADGLTVDGVVTINNATSQRINFTNTGTNPVISSNRALILDIDTDENQTETSVLITANNQAKNVAMFNETGNVHLYEDTGTTAKFVWDSSAEALNITSSSGSPEISLSSDSNTTALKLDNTATSGRAFQIMSHGGGSSLASKLSIYDEDAGIHRFVLDSTGNVGIGTASPSSLLDVSSSVGSTELTGHQILMTRNGNNEIYAQGASSVLALGTNGTERARIDSSGNLLVGKTYTATSLAGQEFRAGGYTAFTRSGGNPLELNRLSYDGTIVNFSKDGSTVGSIGVQSSELYLGSSTGTGDTFLRMGYQAIVPASGTGQNNNGNILLGTANSRFKDLYLSGGVYLGGTGAANKLDDYEEGSWTPLLKSSGNAVVALSSTNGYYTKVGNKVTCWFECEASVDLTDPFYYAIEGVPFSINANHSNSKYIGSATSAQNTVSRGLVHPLQYNNSASLRVFTSNDGTTNINFNYSDAIYGTFTYFI